MKQDDLVYLDPDPAEEAFVYTIGEVLEQSESDQLTKGFSSCGMAKVIFILTGVTITTAVSFMLPQQWQWVSLSLTLFLGVFIGWNLSRLEAFNQTNNIQGHGYSSEEHEIIAEINRFFDD